MPKITERPDRLAINLFDLDLIDETMRSMLLLSRLDLEKPIKISQDNIQETAVRFKCDILTAATACDILQSERRKLNDPEVRLYLNRGNGWYRLGSGRILTVLVGDKPKLNPAIFGALRLETNLAVPLAPEALF